jgi:pilus assembly protein Flp/PilA
MQAMFESLNRMRHFLLRFAAEQSGATSIEYGVMAGAIALVMTASYGALAQTVAAKYGALTVALKDDAVRIIVVK